MTNKLRALIGGVAMLLVLSACYPGLTSALVLSYDVQATISKGKVDLNHWLYDQDGGDGWIKPDGLQGPFSYDRQDGTATVDLNFSQIRGNWNVTGKWIHGDVMMEFSGKSEYLNALINTCQTNFSLSGDEPIWDYEINDNGSPFYDDYFIWGGDNDALDCGVFDTFNDADGFSDYWDGISGGVLLAPEVELRNGVWYRGGCALIPTLYRSLNRDYLGTGHALILVCQNGSGGLTPSWSYPSYIEVWVPDTTWIDQQELGDLDLNFDRDNDYWTACVDWETLSANVCDDEGGGDPEYYLSMEFDDNVYYGEEFFQEDNSPFRNYHAGGINTNRSGKWVVQSRFNNLGDASFYSGSPLFSQEWWMSEI